MKGKETKISPKASLLGTPMENIKTIFGADLRSLALFRIFVAATVIFDLINRSSDLRAHYSDAGVMPRSLVLSFLQNDLWITFHMMSGMTSVQFVLFLIHGLFAFSMLIGYRTRLSTFLTWLFTISLQNRNILVLHGGDILGRQVLWFAMFLPLGDCFSIDNAYRKTDSKVSRNRSKLISPNHYRVASVATFGIGVQLALMYVTSYIHKTGAEWTSLRTATWLALQLDYFRTPFGDFFLNFPELLKLLTAAVLWWEGYGVLFWYAPFLTGPLRTFGVIGFWGMHFGFSLCLRLGQFGCMGMFAVLSLLPTWCWEEVIFRKLRTKERIGFKLFYNPSSTVATKVAIFVENFLVIPESQVLPNSIEEEQEGQQIDSKRDDSNEEIHVDIKPSRTFSSMNSSYLLAQDYRGVYYADYEAIIAICRVSPFLWPLTNLLKHRKVAKVLRPKMASIFQVAGNSRKGQNAHPQVASMRSPQTQVLKKFWKLFKTLSANFFSLLLLLYILSWNAGNIGFNNYSTPNNIRWVAWFLHLDQSWMMFSPRPPNVQWYYIIEGELDKGDRVELFRNEGMFNFEPSEMTWDKPDPFYKSFKNHRWFKYYENGINTHPNNDQLRLNWGRYICREYNARHSGPDRLYKFSIHWMNERAEPDKPRVLQPKQTLWNHVCYDKK